MNSSVSRMDFQVVPYSYSSLCHIIATHIRQPITEVAEKTQLKVIHRGLCALRPPQKKGNNEIHPITMIIETEYIDRSHLRDYAEFEVYSFQEYERYCLRIHIVLDAYPAGAVARTLTGEQHLDEFTAQLKKDYAAFLVIRKQPHTFLAKVVMRFPWKKLQDHFNLSLLRSYRVGFFGHALEVTNSMAWAEQDRVVSACATSALTVQFHSMGLDLHNPRYPSPAQITQMAHTGTPTAKPIFPNAGLNTTMMAMAIRELGLEPYHYRIRSQLTKPTDSPISILDAHLSINQLMRIVHAYARPKLVAPILGVDLYDQIKTIPPQQETQYESQGLHAVTLLGCEKWQPQDGFWEQDYYTFAAQGDPNSIRSVADSLDHVIGHDDQAGPFILCARHKTDPAMVINHANHGLTQITEYLDHLDPNLYSRTATQPVKTQMPNRFRLPDNVLLAMDHQIRVHLFVVEDLTWRFTNDLRILFKTACQLSDQDKTLSWLYCFCPWPENKRPNKDILGEDYNKYFPGYLWDIKLYHVNTLKEELRQQFRDKNQRPVDNTATRLLVRNLPLYLWRASAFSGGHRIVDVLIDATDARTSNMVLQVMVYWKDLHRCAMQVLPEGIRAPRTPQKIPLHNQVILTRWLEQISEQAPTRAPNLDDWYGGSYYPSMIKPHEKKCYYQGDARHGLVPGRSDTDSCSGFEGVRQLLLPPAELSTVQQNHDESSEILFITPRDYSKLHLDKTRQHIKESGWEWRNKQYIWLIDHEGTLVIGQEWPVSPENEKPPKKLGHPNLTGGGPARIAGELKWFNNPEKLEINNKSGRYTKRISGRQEKHLKHAAELFERIFGIETKGEYDSSEYGEGEINSTKDLQRELTDRFMAGDTELYPSLAELKSAGRDLGMALFWSWEILSSSSSSRLSAQNCWTISQALTKGTPDKRNYLMIWSLSTWWKHLLEQTPDNKDPIVDFDHGLLTDILVRRTPDAPALKAASAVALARHAKLQGSTEDTLVSHLHQFLNATLPLSYQDLGLTRAEWDEIHEVILTNPDTRQ